VASFHCKYQTISYFCFILIMTPFPTIDKTLELHFLGASQGGLHPLWSQMLAHRMCRGQNIFKFLGLSHRVFKFLGFESYLMSINHV
jgi:hypothetical protein